MVSAGVGASGRRAIPRSNSLTSTFKDQVTSTKPRRPHVFSSIMDDETPGLLVPDPKADKSFTLPSSGRYGSGKGKASPQLHKKFDHDIPYRPPSPLLLEHYHAEPPGAPASGAAINRSRAKSVGAFSFKRIKNTLI